MCVLPHFAMCECEESPLTFTRSVIPTRCTFAVSLHGVRRQHQQCAGPRIAPRPRVGEIRSRRTTVTFRFVRSYPARYGPRTQTGAGPGVASESVRFGLPARSTLVRLAFSFPPTRPCQFCRPALAQGCICASVVAALYTARVLQTHTCRSRSAIGLAELCMSNTCSTPLVLVRVLAMG